MKQAICLFEDANYSNFLPLVYFRPVYDLKCGILTLREKILKRLSHSDIILHSRKYLTDSLKEKYLHYHINQFNFDSILFINGRLLADKKNTKVISKIDDNKVITCKGEVVAFKLSGNNLKRYVSNITDYMLFDKLVLTNSEECEVNLIKFPWDIIHINGQEITNDFALITKKIKKTLPRFKSVELVNKNNIHIGTGTSIEPFSYIDASEGPIYIGKNVRILSHSVIKGPVYIGDNSIIKAHASINHNTSIGEVCKVGGEIENSIFHSYSNKQHEGFLGHSYLGSWINIGAGTNNSNLKINYTDVDVLYKNRRIDTGCQFMGMIMGDHSKTAINTMFNTGSIIGVFTNIYSIGFPTKYIPSFCWLILESIRTFDLNKAIDIARIVMKRRKIELTKTDEDLIQHVFELTSKERKK